MVEETFYREHGVPQELSPWVESVWEARSTPGEVSTILPDTCSDLLFERTSELDAIRFVGTMTAPRSVAGESRKVLGVRFRPGGAYSLLGQPSEPAVDASLPFVGRLAIARPAEAFEARESIVAALVQAISSVDKRNVKKMRVAQLCATLHRRKITDLADEVGVTRQQLRRITLQATGLSPKQLARVGRARTLLRRLPGHATSLAHLAAELGYADQSHMTAECGAIFGTSPQKLATL